MAIMAGTIRSIIAIGVGIRVITVGTTLGTTTVGAGMAGTIPGMTLGIMATATGADGGIPTMATGAMVMVARMWATAIAMATECRELAIMGVRRMAERVAPLMAALTAMPTARLVAHARVRSALDRALLALVPTRAPVVRAPIARQVATSEAAVRRRVLTVPRIAVGRQARIALPRVALRRAHIAAVAVRLAVLARAQVAVRLVVPAQVAARARVAVALVAVDNVNRALC